MANDVVSDEDKALFREYTRSVKQLKEKTKKVNFIKPKPSLPSPKKMPRETELLDTKEYYLSDVIINIVLPDTILSYSHPSLSRQRFKALKCGQIRWEARLDLHGLKSEQARETLCRFITTQEQDNKRCLLIIHGKGHHLMGEPPVIKNLINRWLPQFEEIMGFHSALPKDGGSGAVYVLLKSRLKERDK